MKLFIIIRKELIDQIRDKRTIIAAILMPAVIVPLLLFLTSQSTADEEITAPVRIIIEKNETRIRGIILDAFSDTLFMNTDSPLDAIKNGKADLLIQTTKSGDRYRTLTIHYDLARRESAVSCARIHDLLILHLKGTATAVNDLQITPSPVRSEKENKTLLTLSLILPVFLIVFAASSTMSSAIDMSAGEKERSTIETLLCCNISHSAIILGKIFAASIVGFASVLSLLTGLLICSHIYPQITGGLSLMKFSGLANVALMSAISSLSVFLFATAGMAIGLFAKSVKEGTVLTIPVIILGSALSSGFIANDPFTFDKIYLIIPVLNFSCIIRSIIFNHLDASVIAISVIANLFYVMVFFVICRKLLNKETVIFRS